MYNHKCPKCGANLDPGERCDCGMDMTKRVILSMALKEDLDGEMPAQIMYDGEPEELYDAINSLLTILCANLISDGESPWEVVGKIAKAASIQITGNDDLIRYMAEKAGAGREERKQRLVPLRGGLI